MIVSSLTVTAINSRYEVIAVFIMYLHSMFKFYLLFWFHLVYSSIRYTKSILYFNYEI